MELIINGRHIKVSERFRRLCEEKLAKVEQYAPRSQRIEVVVSEETSRGTPKGSERVEITVVDKGPVVRAEAHADDKYAALDLALAKLIERLRRVHEKKRVSRRRAPRDQAGADLHVTQLVAPPEAERAQDEPLGGDDELARRLGAQGDSPVEVREKTHVSAPMTLDQALYAMELVGHDFFLFHDVETDRPSVVYRRRGWRYGVLHLDASGATGVDGSADGARAASPLTAFAGSAQAG